MAVETYETFEAHLTEMLEDPEFQAAWEASEPAYQVTRLRILRGLTQAQLAELVDTKQPSIARLESGRDEPKISFLRRVAEALGARLEVRFVPLDDGAGSAAEKTSATARAA